MPPSTPRLRILSVGGNAVSAFLSWRLQATQACDVTLVWKSNFEAVSQYGITFKSKIFGNERFKPLHVVRTPEDAAATSRTAYDYVLLCVKALPDVYDLAAIIESVVAPQHTCILINTTNTLGVESYLESRFPTNVVLSLVSGAEIVQLGASEFEHVGATDIWVGPATKNPSIPASIQSDMAEALAMTLSSGQVDCRVSTNIRQQQYERMIGPIAFHPASVIFETPSHAELLEKVGVRSLVSDVIDELMQVAVAQGCTFPLSFKENVMEDMIKPTESQSIMYQDYTARRPMEIETYLGSPIKLAQEMQVSVKRIETLYALMHNLNVINQSRPAQPVASQAVNPPPRMSSVPQGGRPPMPNGRPSTNGMRPGSRAPSMSNGPPPPHMRRGPPNGYGPRGPPPNGYPPRGGPGQLTRRSSFEGDGLEEFSHVMLYENMQDGGDGAAMYAANGANGDLDLRERELMIRQKELALREQEMRMRGGPRRGAPSQAFDDDDDEDDYFDPMASSGHLPQVNPDNIDMMSVTSRRTRKAPSAQQMRRNPEMGGRGGPRGFGRPGLNRNRTSTALMGDMPSVHEDMSSNPMIGYSSDRYGGVDRFTMGQESRTNSLTADKLQELQQGNGYGGYPPFNRRASQSPGNPLGPPNPRHSNRPSPPNGAYYGPPGSNGMPRMNGRPSPPGMQQPVPRHPPGHGNAVAPQAVEQRAGGVSHHYPTSSKTFPPQVRSLTGSASASAGSGDSHHMLESDPSAHSSSSSLGPRPPIGVR